MNKINLAILTLITMFISTNAFAVRICGSVGAGVVSVNVCVGTSAADCPQTSGIDIIGTVTIEGTSYTGCVSIGRIAFKDLPKGTFADLKNLTLKADGKGNLTVSSYTINCNVKDNAEKLKLENKLMSGKYRDDTVKALNKFLKDKKVTVKQFQTK